MSRPIKIVFVLFVFCTLAVSVQANNKRLIKDKVKEGVFEEFAGALAELPGLEQMLDKIRTNRYQLTTNSETPGMLIINNFADAQSATISRTRKGNELKMLNKAYLSPGIYWLRAQPEDDELRPIERRIWVHKKMRSTVDLKFWPKFIKEFPLEIDTVPAEAKVRVMNIGPKYQYGMRLKAGEYLLEISAEGYKSRRQTIRLDHNQNQFGFRLTALPTADNTQQNTETPSIEQSASESHNSEEDSNPQAKPKKEYSTSVKILAWVMIIGGFLLFGVVTYYAFRLLFKALSFIWHKVAT